MDWTHYIVVRRDLPIGDVVAQVTHAAGESFYKKAQVAQILERRENGDGCARQSLGSSFADRRSDEGSSNVEHHASENGASQTLPRPTQIAGSLDVKPSIVAGDGTSQVPPRANQTVAVVLGARNEHRLRKLEEQLLRVKVPHVTIRESEGKYRGQLMAIGLLPDHKENIMAKVPYLNDFHMLSECNESS